MTAIATKPQSRRVRLIERTSGAGRVDRDNGIIRRVKILGRESRNGRTYSQRALEQAAKLYENRRVCINHPDRRFPDADRGVAEHFGKLVNVTVRSDGVFGDLKFNRKHPLAEQVCELAENMPDQIGLSHNADGDSVMRNGRQVVEMVRHVRSVDLVLNPASTAGLFESVGSDALHRRLDRLEERIDRLRERGESYDALSQNRGWTPTAENTSGKSAGSETDYDRLAAYRGW